MASPETAPYGTWQSPISTDILTQKAIKLDDAIVDPTDSKVYHVESRPDEAGRNVVVDTATGKDIFGSEFNARSSVHEYGGNPAIAYGGKVVFSNVKDKHLYVVDGSSAAPKLATPENPEWRYGNVVIYPTHQHLFICILEDHTKPEPMQVENKLVVVNSEKRSVSILAEGADFYSSPSISPDAKHLAFIRWFHPDMPWEGGELVVTTIEATSDGQSLKIGTHDTPAAGKRGTYSVQQPEWIDDTRLIFLSDDTGFLNPFAYDLNTEKTSELLKERVNEDFGDPPWIFGTSSFAILDPQNALFTSVRGGKATLYHVDLSTGALKDLQTPYVDIFRIRRVSSDSIVFVGKKTDEAESLVLYSHSRNEYKTLKATSNIIASMPKGIISVSQSFSFAIAPTNDPVHVLYYEPKNPAYVAKEGEKPPCIVHIHGGPTHRSLPGLTWEKQFFTSRGFGWLDVNYGGSTGYGTKYINRLRGKWGIVDVEDSLQAVTQLAAVGLIDEKRVAIRGGSSGGYTVLAAITTHPTFFAVATSLFGISELIGLAQTTHKFEAKYGDRLIGGTVKDDVELYKRRSPLYSADKIKAPTLILQGSEDRVVPPEQARQMVETIEKNKGKVKYIEFEGEGHGWRQASTIKTALEVELGWYMEVYGLT